MPLGIATRITQASVVRIGQVPGTARELSAGYSDCSTPRHADRISLTDLLVLTGSMGIQ